MATIPRYHFLQRLLHWIITLMVVGLLAGGFTFWTLGYEGTSGLFGAEMTNQLYNFHKSFGILVLLLMVLRLIMRRVWPAPAYDPPISGGQKFVGHTVHVLLYLLLLGIPIGGAVATTLGGFPVTFFDWTLPAMLPKNEALSEQVFLLHGIAGLVLTALVVLHAAGAIKHAKLKDGVMRRITLP